eukprot:TRINITY_DN19132_c0_g1_i1.p1 TRINITY_DN19132_c0_g1~~TRINITY_DN19132_c0_g1_i1.p1  ORF type:complete len:450 (+),score=113.08 TRINITY_DN19132_c0_g1_i1:71-1351(+)
MATVWVRRRHEPPQAEVKVSLPPGAHVSDVLGAALSVLVFTERAQVGGVAAWSVDGRLVSNRDEAAAYHNKTLVVDLREAAPRGGGEQVVGHPPAASSMVAVSSAAPPPPPGGVGGSHVCAHCGKPIVGLKVVLTLPGSTQAADLHPECEAAYEKANALPCAFCGDLVLDRLTTLTGDFGTINLHPQCVDLYKRTTLLNPLSGDPQQPSSAAHASIAEREAPVPPAAHSLPGPPGGYVPPPAAAAAHTGPGGYVPPPAATSSPAAAGPLVPAPPAPSHAAQYICAQCGEPIEGTKISLKLPGFNHKVDLHPHCEHVYSMTHALRCDYCSEPMMDGITVLTGSFADSTTTKQLHPNCVAAFKKNGMGCPGQRPPSGWNAPFAVPNTQWQPLAGATPTGPSKAALPPHPQYAQPQAQAYAGYGGVQGW